MMDGVSASSTAKPLADEAIATIIIIRPGASMHFYRAALSLSSQTLAYTTGIIRRHHFRRLHSSQTCDPPSQPIRHVPSTGQAALRASRKRCGRPRGDLSCDAVGCLQRA